MESSETGFLLCSDFEGGIRVKYEGVGSVGNTQGVKKVVEIV
jgi:hypothetical protein